MTVVSRAVRQQAPAVVVEKPGRPKMVVYVFGHYSNLLLGGIVSGFKAEDVGTKHATEADLTPSAKSAKPKPGGKKS